MKKFILAITLVAIFLTGTLRAEAYNQRGSLPKSEMYLGGVTLYSSMNGGWSNIIKIYGKPNGVNGYAYGDNVVISGAEGSITSILVTANNGWKTPSGIGVGTSVSELMEKYGEPYLSKTYNNKTVYCYCSGGNAYSVGDRFLHFLFDKNTKKITKILLSGNTARMGEPKWILDSGFRELLGIDNDTYEKL